MTEPVIAFCLLSKQGDWTINTHSRHGSKEHDRPHVHISKRGIKGEYSWNDDGSRHDKHRFPKSEEAIKRAKELAGRALGIDPSICQLITQIPSGYSVYVYQYDDKSNKYNVQFSTYIHANRIGIVLEHPECLIIVTESA